MRARSGSPWWTSTCADVRRRKIMSLGGEGTTNHQGTKTPRSEGVWLGFCMARTSIVRDISFESCGREDGLSKSGEGGNDE
jgi:hypothetical protein